MRILKLLLSISIVILFFYYNNISALDSNKVKSKDGVEITFISQGNGEPALIFVHGLGMDKSEWNEQIKFFSKKYKTVALDLAGHGESGKNRKEWTITKFGYDVAAVVNKLNLKKVILIGHALGGYANLEAAKILGPRVIGIIGVEAYQRFDTGEPADRAEAFLQTFKDNFKGIMNEYARSLFLPDADTLLINKVAPKMRALDSTSTIDIFRHIYRYNLMKAIVDVKMPITAIVSSRFPAFTKENKKILKTYNSKMIMDAGHFLMFEKPAELNELIEETVKEIIGGK